MAQRTLAFLACAIQRCTWALTWRLCNLSLFYAGGMVASCAMLLRNNLLLSATRCFAKLRANGALTSASPLAEVRLSTDESERCSKCQDAHSLRSASHASTAYVAPLWGHILGTPEFTTHWN